MNDNRRHVSFDIETGEATTPDENSSMIVHTARSGQKDKTSRLKQEKDLNKINITNTRNDLQEALAISKRLIQINANFSTDLQASEIKIDALRKKLQDSYSLNLLLGTVLTSALFYTWLSWQDSCKTA